MTAGGSPRGRAARPDPRSRSAPSVRQRPAAREVGATDLGSRVGHRSLRFAVELRVPLRFAYRWLTDFQDADARFFGPSLRITVVQRSPGRVIRLLEPDPPENRHATVELITLSPPDRWTRWQLDPGGDTLLSYRLTRRSNRGSRLTLRLRRAGPRGALPGHDEFVRSEATFYREIVGEIEADYAITRDRARGSPAVG